MAGWDIDPSGVSGVLKKTQSEAQGFETNLKTISSSMETAAPNTSSGLVAKSLSGFAEKLKPQVESVVNLTGSAMTGCAEAVKAYQQGDLEMAAQAQSNAAGVTTPDMPRGGGRSVAQ